MSIVTSGVHDACYGVRQGKILTPSGHCPHIHDSPCAGNHPSRSHVPWKHGINNKFLPTCTCSPIHPLVFPCSQPCSHQGSHVPTCVPIYVPIHVSQCSKRFSHKLPCSQTSSHQRPQNPPTRSQPSSHVPFWPKCTSFAILGLPKVPKCLI